jgi:hypothetical protein
MPYGYLAQSTVHGNPKGKRVDFRRFPRLHVARSCAIAEFARIRAALRVNRHFLAQILANSAKILIPRNYIPCAWA